MPNGESTNWIRLLLTIESFRNKYGHWTTKVHLDPVFVSELRCKLSPEDWRTLRTKLAIIEDSGRSFVVQDDQCQTYDYSGSSTHGPGGTTGVLDWLGIGEPEYDD